MKQKALLVTSLVLALTISIQAETNELFSSCYEKYQQSFSELKVKLGEWTQSPKPQTGYLSPIEEDAYSIFVDIWNPTNLNRLGEFEAEGFESWYAQSPYFLVQNHLNIRTELGKDTYTTNIIDDFVPMLGEMQAKTIVLTDERKEVLLKFLGDEEHPLGYGGIMNPSRAKGESRKRAIFLSEMLPIQHGHWGGWNLITYPEIFEIVFNKTRTEASVDFRIGYQGGTAVYEKKNDKWGLKESNATWVE